MKRALRSAAFLTVLALWAMPARAELVFFASGQSLNVKGHRLDGDTLVLSLRAGGEIECPSSTVVRITPDEVPWIDEEIQQTPDPTADRAAGSGGRLPADSHAVDSSGIRLQADPQYDPIIQRVAAEQGVNAQLVRAVIQVESGYEPRARSRKGAVGLMQVMPDTARRYGIRNPYDPESNIEAGIKHLKSLLDRLPLNLTLAAYNAGEAAVERFRGIPPYPETRSYVANVLRLVNR